MSRRIGVVNLNKDFNEPVGLLFPFEKTISQANEMLLKFSNLFRLCILC